MKRTKAPEGKSNYESFKSHLAKDIIKRFPKHLHYVEPYFGGGAVLFAKTAEFIEDHSEVINDVNGRLVNFWTVLRDNLPDLQLRLELTPFAEDEFEAAVDLIGCEFDELDAAAKFFIQFRQSRQGLGRDFATLSRTRTRRGMNGQVSSLFSAVDGLPEAAERLRRVVVLNRDALSVIRSQDGPDTLFYLDPPYLHETRTATQAYDHEMTTQQHQDLLNVLTGIKGKVILSGYPSKLYSNHFAELPGWRCEAILIDNKASSAKSKEKKRECLWVNFPAEGNSN